MESESAIDLGRVAQDLQLRKAQVAAVVELLDAQNTVPFITRYRKEQTGGLDEEQIRAIQHRVGLLRQLADRRQTILRTIESQGKLTDELKQAIERADTLKRLEDLYLPYKPKKQTLATIARDRGLGPMADAIWTRDPVAANLAELLPGMINPEKQLNTVEDVLTGVQHILAEKIAEDAEARDAARDVLWDGRLLSTRATTIPDATSNEPGMLLGLEEFRNYFNYQEPVRHVPPHRVLALNRGEHRGVLKVRLEVDVERMVFAIRMCLQIESHPHREILERCVVDAVDRLLLRSLEREARGEMTEYAERHAVDVFARNLRNLLLQPPIHQRRVLAIDPGYRTGCKWAVIDEIGNLMEHGNIFPHLKRKKKKKKGTAASVRTGPGNLSAASAEPAKPFAEELTEEEGPSLTQEEPTPPESAAAEPPPGDDEPPILPADAVYRSTDSEGSGDERGEITREWQALNQSFEGSSASPARPGKRRDRRRRGPRRPSYASAGIVVPPPGLFEEETPTMGQQEAGESAEAQVSRRERAKKLLKSICERHRVDVFAIGNGTACRETEELIAEMISDGYINIPYVIVNEAGASVYSTSTIGREEFPEFDATLRGAISIGRRLQDPLSELVKIDPQNIGVGLYQHDINPRLLKESLSEVVESCVNYVGVDVNTASIPLLRYVSGLNQLRAKNLVEYRKQNGPLRSREELRKVNGIGPESFTQAAGFLKITGGDEPLDSTWIHPESYAVTEKVLELVGYDRSAFGTRTETDELKSKVSQIVPGQLADQLAAGEPTVRDILDNLLRPGRDPREDLPKPIFRTGILRIEDLQPHMELKGTVLNVVDFGVFVDIGLKDSGLVHISEVADRFIRRPDDVVSVGDIVTTWVLNVDMERRRVSLTMIDPTKPRPPRGPRRGPPRRDRQENAPRQEAPAGQTSGDRPSEGARREQQDRRPAQARPQQGQQGDRREGERGGGGNRHQRGRGHREPQRDQGPRVITARPKEKKPPVKLTEDKMTGKQDLHSFGELKALFEMKKKDEPPKKQPPKAGGEAPAES